MHKKINFRAEGILIEQARLRAKAGKTTLNAEFQKWLVQYTDSVISLSDLEALMDQFKYVHVGSSFNRDESNDRI